MSPVMSLMTGDVVVHFHLHIMLVFMSYRSNGPNRLILSDVRTDRLLENLMAFSLFYSGQPHKSFPARSDKALASVLAVALSRVRITAPTTLYQCLLGLSFHPGSVNE